jgi:hypothetical protein
MSPGAPKVVWGQGSTLIYEDHRLLSKDEMNVHPKLLGCISQDLLLTG